MKDNKLPQEMKICSNQNLKDVLYEELDKERPDRDTVLGILEELEQREAEKQKNNTRKTPRWIRKTAIAAAVLLAFVFGAPLAFGAENIFQLVGWWTEDIFALRNPDETGSLMPEYVFKTNHPGLQQVYDAVTKRGVTQKVVPTWLPDGFRLAELKDMSDLNGVSFYAEFEGENGGLLLLLSQTRTTMINKYPKEDESAIVHEMYGIKHYLIQNEGNWNAAWSADTMACTLITTLDRDTVFRIINSIYMEGT